jgi:tRNA(Ile)-lysidine synthase TilS/MesJ
MTKAKTKALALLSGGLDSILAIKLLQKQLKIIAVNFSSPFFSEKNAVRTAKQLKVKLIKIDLNKGKNFSNYIKIIKKPHYGYGSSLNPCIDCKIFMLKKAKQVMKKLKADFIVTGEVLNERMTQTKNKLILIETEAKLKGKILRPLSARLLPEIEVEKRGLVNRNKLLNMIGRSRKKQIELAKKYNLKYLTPAGGCLLCEKEFTPRLKDLFKHKKKIKPIDIELLKLGRHFRYKENKIIVGRNEQENKKLLKLKNKTKKNTLMFEAKDFPSPITLLIGKTSKTSQKVKVMAAALTSSYCDAKNEKKVTVKYGKRKFNKAIEVFPLNRKEIENLRIK